MRHCKLELYRNAVSIHVLNIYSFINRIIVSYIPLAAHALGGDVLLLYADDDGANWCIVKYACMCSRSFVY